MEIEDSDESDGEYEEEIGDNNPFSEDDSLPYEDSQAEAAACSATQQPSKMMECRFVKSKRLGAYPLLLDSYNYTYRRKGFGRKKTIVYYNCSEMMSACCPAGAVYNTDCEGYIIKFKGIHTHPSDPQALRAMLEERTVIDTVVDSLGSQQMKPQQVREKILHNLEKAGCSESLAFVSSTESIRGRFRRAQEKANITVPVKVPKTWEKLKKQGIPAIFTKTESETQFLR